MPAGVWKVKSSILFVLSMPSYALVAREGIDVKYHIPVGVPTSFERNIEWCALS